MDIKTVDQLIEEITTRLTYPDGDQLFQKLKSLIISKEHTKEDRKTDSDDDSEAELDANINRDIGYIMDEYNNLIDEKDNIHICQLKNAIKNVDIIEVREETAGNNIYYSDEVIIGSFYFNIVCNGYHKDPLHSMFVKSEKHKYKHRFEDNYTPKGFIFNEDLEQLTDLIYSDLNDDFAEKDNKEIFTRVINIMINNILYKIVMFKLF